jgi:hypothetical protein
MRGIQQGAFGAGFLERNKGFDTGGGLGVWRKAFPRALRPHSSAVNYRRSQSSDLPQAKLAATSADFDSLTKVRLACILAGLQRFRRRQHLSQL